MKRITYRRLIALVIDCIFISLIFSVLTGFFTTTIELGTFNIFGKRWMAVFELYFLVTPGYFILFDALNKGTSFGKAMLHIKTVTEKDHEIPGIFMRFGRSLVKSIATTIPLISLIYYLIQHKTIQDSVAKTETIYYKD